MISVAVLLAATAFTPAMSGPPPAVIERYAGGGVGDGGAATSAILGGPSQIALDSAGNLYIADILHSRIRKVSPSGTISTVAGTAYAAYTGDGGPATSGSLDHPRGVAVDSAGALYIGDTNNRRIRKVSPSGTITTVAGTGEFAFSGDGGPATEASLASPTALALDSADNLYFIDGIRVRKVDSSGIISTVAGNGTREFAGDGGPATSAGIGPSAVSVDSSGNLYILDNNNHRVRRVNPAGIITTVAGNGQPGFSGDGGPATSASLNYPVGVSAGPGGTFFIGDTWNNRIRKVGASGIISTVAGNGQQGFSGDGGSATSAKMYLPTHVVADSAGGFHLTDGGNLRVRRVSSSGIITTVAGNGSCCFFGDDGPATSARLYRPTGLAFDSSGNLYIADTNNNRIRRVGASGTITTVAGNGSCCFFGDGGPATNARINHPRGLAFDSSGNLYIADTDNHRIRKVSASGTITTVAGNGSAGYAGDGGQATSASLYRPSGVALDLLGNLHIADTDNHRIRKVDASGTITTVAGTGTMGYSGEGRPAILSSVSRPEAIVFDKLGNLYIADMGNRMIRVVLSAAMFSVAGTNAFWSRYAFRDDGGPARLTAIVSPAGVALDEMGNIYFSDPDNSVVRVVGGPVI